jgi:hypothetical protein
VSTPARVHDGTCTGQLSLLAVSRQCQNHDGTRVVGDNSRAGARRSPANRATFALPDQAPGKKRARPDVVGAPDQHPIPVGPCFFKEPADRHQERQRQDSLEWTSAAAAEATATPPSCQNEHGTLRLCDVGPRPIVSV